VLACANVRMPAPSFVRARLPEIVPAKEAGDGVVDGERDGGGARIRDNTRAGHVADLLIEAISSKVPPTVSAVAMGRRWRRQGTTLPAAMFGPRRCRCWRR